MKNFGAKLFGKLASMLSGESGNKKFIVTPPPPENSGEEEWRRLLELKKKYSGADGMTSDLAQIGEIINFYKSLPPEVKQKHAKEFVRLMNNSVNWKEAFSVFTDLDGGWMPEDEFRHISIKTDKKHSWEGLLELKKQYSGPDGLTADPMQIARLAAYYKSLPEVMRQDKENEFAILMQKCNWEYAFPFFRYVNGTHSPDYTMLFKKFFLTESEIQAKVTKLKSNLDATSCDQVDNFIIRTLQLPEFAMQSSKKIIFGNALDLEAWLADEAEKKAIAKYEKEFPQYQSEYAWERFNKCFEPSVFTFHHGLRYRGKEVKDYLANRHFIDGGAWMGDSALVLARHYKPAKIHSFEISPEICRKYREVMKANGIPESLFVINNLGLGEKSGETVFCDNKNEGNTLYGDSSAEMNNQPRSRCEITTIDDYVAENKLDVSFIKLDLEGFGLAAIKGAAKAIKSQMPVLSVGIYHTPEEFFEIKPFIEEITEQYSIYIERHHTDYTSCWDTNLMAIPKFLLPA